MNISDGILTMANGDDDDDDDDLPFSYLVDNRKCCNLTLKLTLLMTSVHVDNNTRYLFLEKVLAIRITSFLIET